MHYLCPRCQYEAFEYRCGLDKCPKCENTEMLFHHLGFRGPDHWVLVNLLTGLVIGYDICENILREY